MHRDMRFCLELKRVHRNLLEQSPGVGGRVFGEQRLEDVDALLAQHRVEERAHGVLDFLGGEHAEALRAVVDAVAGLVVRLFLLALKTD